MDSRFCQMTEPSFSERVPGSPPTEEDRKGFKGAELGSVRSKGDIYNALRESINSVFAVASAKDLLVRDMANRHAHDGFGKRSGALNDVGIYLNNPRAVSAIAYDDKRRAERRTNAGRDNSIGRHSLHWLAIPIIVKRDATHTPFHFDDSDACSEHPPIASSSASPPMIDAPSTLPPPDGFERCSIQPFLRQSTDGKEALVQFTECMLDIFENQHRLISYAIYVWRHSARLCIFDRGGAIISDAFNWTTPDSPLHDFLWRVTQMSEAELGYDQTAKHVDDEHDKVRLFKGMSSSPAVPEEIRPFVEQAVSEGYPIYKVTIIPMAAPADERFPDDPFPPQPRPDSSSPPPLDPAPPTKRKKRSFLIGKPHFSSDSLFGRCTRGYVAYDIDSDRLCFLKDYWRPYVPNRMRPEHLVYERMARCGVTGVPTLICGGDVEGMHAQETQMQNALHILKNIPKQVPRIHYRLATVELGLPLESFTNFKELALVFADAVYAHHQAWTKAKVVHGDISTGNILIDPGTRVGLLIDWELARVECELASGPTEPERIGTWPFCSALAVSYPRKPHRLSDDLEAFVHSFNYLVLKYHPTDLNGLRMFIMSTYEDYALRVVGERRVRVGGDMKMARITSQRPPFRVCGNAALQNVLTQLHKGCYESYKGVDLHQMERLYGVESGVEDESDESDDEDDEDGPESAPPHEMLSDLESDEDSEPPVPPSMDRAAAPAQSHSSSSQAQTTSATSATQSAAASDPCALQGFLAGHAGLVKVLLAYEEEAEVDDKHPDQFELRKGEECHILPPQRPSTQSISTMSTTTGSDLALDLGDSSVTTSVGSCRSSDIAGSSRKRPRPVDEEEKEDVEGGDAGSQTMEAGPTRTDHTPRQSIVSRVKKQARK